ncbi:TetR/AcrR family transcriptional regulator [Wohlfahrtiimonas larvae]|uniref:Efflux pump transcriptional regulator FepR n=1 Tax=Wohlfahrtiimonas larvae TaxID=1157986 RepID=A0ABP9MEB7_9GAMM|nr:TetR/AcrR family transcriptional regulator [Wohlfahrtiimonas larvae]
MTASKLQNAALIRFAVQGFNATTMNEIANDVGIKKASIYAHFSSKDDLFLSLLPILVAEEYKYTQSMISGGDQIESQLLAYLTNINTRFEESYHMRFWLRILFAPPVHLHDEVVVLMRQLMDDIESWIEAAIAASPLVNNGLDSQTLTLSYMAMMDSLHTELLFAGPEKYQTRLTAVWHLFETAIR